MTEPTLPAKPVHWVQVTGEDPEYRVVFCVADWSVQCSRRYCSIPVNPVCLLLDTSHLKKIYLHVFSSAVRIFD